MQAVLAIEGLPQDPLGAAAQFHARHLVEAERLLEAADTGALAIVLPAAASDHDDWRRTLARDFARRWTPKRVNVVAGGPGEAREATLAYLADAPGLTGQYVALHE